MIAGTSRLDAQQIDFVRSVVEAKGTTRISVCLPCRNEERSVGGVVDALCDHPVWRDLIDELIVIDDGSTDRSAEIAAAAGATVVPIDSFHERYGPGRGKGNALWVSMLASSGDLVVWVDADVRTVDLTWVAHLVLPMLQNPGVALVKATYCRPQDEGGGGRTTELVIRPLVSLLAPELAWVAQPLSGEVAVRRSMVETVPFVQGWGVEIAMILDIAERFGAAAIAQADLGERRHRHHDLMDLRLQATEVMATLLRRRGVPLAEADPALVLADGSRTPLNLDERPPVVSLRDS
ncbi:MAG: glucosyl-3-phosphoglycerate synthase [Actinobacteria bacterium]|nr:glucosyl-3-phosphoglycerate synthase [Actinomycetota bacterium]